jgi:hypothetical protein
MQELAKFLKTEVQKALEEALEEQNAIAGGGVAATSTGGKKPQVDLWSNPMTEANNIGGLYGFSLTGDGEMDGTQDDPDPDAGGEHDKNHKKKRKAEKNPTAEIMWDGDGKPGTLKILKYTALEEGVSLNPKTVKITCEKKLDPRSIEVIKDFIRFCQGKLEIEEYPHFFFYAVKQANMTTGSYIMENNTLHVLVGHRLIMDVLRTIAHELTHRKQHETGLLDQELAKQDPLDEMGDLNTVYENEAYEKSGNFVKEFARVYKKLPKDELYSLHEQKNR